MRTRVLLVAAGPVVFAAMALLMGKASGWDLLNYHWYNPYAFLNGRFGFDVAVGHHSSYFNPLADVPLFLIATHAPAWVGGLYMGAMAGLAVALVGVAAYFLIPLRNERRRLCVVSVIALLGASGAGALAAIGDPYNDILVGLGSLGALCLLMVRFDSIRQPALESQAVTTLIIAGICAGASIGFKLTTAPYACGLVAALLVLPGSVALRIKRATLFSLGVALGLAIVDGFWMYEMWRYSGNPLFPYFNDVFHSNLLLDFDYRDPNFQPRAWQRYLLLPYDFTVNSRVSSEQTFRDARLLATCILITATGVTAAVWKMRGKRLAGDVIDPLKSAFLLVFAGVTYVAWLVTFTVYRYLIPLEMLMPLLIVAAVMIWPARIRIRLGVIGVVLFATLAVERVSIERDSWAGPYVGVEVPELADPERTMILMSGYEPLSFVIPSFPPQIPFLRIDGWLAGAEDHKSGLALAMRARVAAHSGPLYLMYLPRERDRAEVAAKGYRLSLARDNECLQVRSNISEPLALCRAHKL